ADFLRRSRGCLENAASRNRIEPAVRWRRSGRCGNGTIGRRLSRRFDERKRRSPVQLTAPTMFMHNWLLFIGVPLLLGLWAQWRVSSAFAKYSRIGALSGMTGADVAREILQAAQIHDVEVVQINGWLGDHYDPMSKRLCLSTQTYSTPSLAAVGIAAHE